jgi:tRNA(adenine34) deaminase
MTQESNAMPVPTDFMHAAIVEAGKARELGEVPIGAVVVADGRIVSRAHNEVESRHDASAHAEMLAIQRASEQLGTWRLNEASLFVTLEPCTMCIGAMVLARIKEVYFGCYDPRQGAVGSLYDLSSHSDLPHNIQAYSGVLEEECRELLTSFFEKLRQK